MSLCFSPKHGNVLEEFAVSGDSLSLLLPLTHQIHDKDEDGNTSVPSKLHQSFIHFGRCQNKRNDVTSFQILTFFSLYSSPLWIFWNSSFQKHFFRGTFQCTLKAFLKAKFCKTFLQKLLISSQTSSCSQKCSLWLWK